MVGVLLLISLAVSPTTQSTTQPSHRSADSAVDEIFSTATSAPATPPVTSKLNPPTTAPSPLTMGKADPDVRTGTITLNDGTTITGQIATTAGKPMRIWDDQAKEFRDLPLRMVTSITAQVLWEKDEPQYRFKESGSDIKVETGKTYPARETAYKFSLTDGSTVTGGIVAPLYLSGSDGGSTTYILHKRDKGDPGQTLPDLKYVKQVDFGK